MSFLKGLHSPKLQHLGQEAPHVQVNKRKREWRGFCKQ